MAFKKGTTIHETPLRFIDCAHAPQCGHSAMIREKLTTGWANLCIHHYLEHIERERNARWIAAGRPTKEQSLAKMKGLFLKGMGGDGYAARVSKRVEREPGMDDEEARQVSA